MPIRWTVRFARDTRNAATAILLLAAWASSLAHAQNQACTPVMARVVSLQGNVELRSAKGEWQRVKRLDTPLCQGDRLRTGPNSRAALFIPPENLLRVDQNTSVSVHVTQDETVLEFFTDETSRGTACGAGYAISRFPRKFRINTPFSYAAVEGTEFLVALSCTQATISVFEGKVSVEQRIEQASKVVLGPGQTTSVGPDQPPVVQVLVKPTDAVQWAVYYPSLADAQFGADALHAPCESLAEDKRPACLLERAEALVRAGQVSEAQADIRDLLALQPNDGDAFALRAVISVARNEKADALRFAQQATTLSPQAYRPWLALSYAQQASFDLEQALESSQRAAALVPANGLVQARVAELLMSLGRIREAERAARQAVAADPKQSRGYVILGFVQLAEIDIKSAHQSFNQAIELDSADPLPRLGLGLAIIRDGKLKEGREQIEIAVALDPTNSLLRSYLGKAYYEEDTEKRDQLAASQYSLAKELDPKDPTPWFYDAILKQTQNQAVEALENVQKSIVLNDNRAVYRSRLLLDQDLADRGGALARVFSDLGFGQLAQIEGWRALQTDAASASAHRFLADSYLGAPRHEVARLSELLQSQLWQPLNLQPIQPQLEETDLFIVRGASPSATSLAEFNPMFVRDGTWIQTDLVVANNDTIGGDLVVAALKGPVSLSAGGFHYETEGFRANNDHTLDFANAFIQVAPQPETMLQAEVRWRGDDHGDLPLRFDPTQFSTSFRLQSDVDTYRFGLRQSLSERSSVIVSLLHQHSETNQHESRTIPPSPFPGDLTIDTQSSQDADLAEVQNVYRYGPMQLISGLGFLQSNDQASGQSVSQIFVPFPPFVIPKTTPLALEQDTEQVHGYIYAQAHFYDRVSALLGLSVDELSAPQADVTQVNPKLGLAWRVGRGTTVRAAAFRTLSRDLINNQTIEPTLVAGFNQFFDEPVGTDAKSYGIGIDQTFSPRLFASAQAVTRNLSVPYFAGSTTNRASADATQHFGSGYLYWTPLNRLALRAEYYYDSRERSSAIVPRGYDYVDLTTQWGVAGMTWLVSGSWSVFANATLVDQSGTFLNTLNAATTQGSDQFWLVDAEVRWRIPLRHGFVSAGVRNLFDQSFQFHEPDAGNPTFYPGRFFYVRLNVKL